MRFKENGVPGLPEIRFAPDTQVFVKKSAELAKEKHDTQVHTGYLLNALLEHPSAKAVFNTLSVNIEHVSGLLDLFISDRRATLKPPQHKKENIVVHFIKSLKGKEDEVAKPEPANQPLRQTPLYQKMLEYAVDETLHDGRSKVEVGDLLVAMGKTTEGITAGILFDVLAVNQEAFIAEARIQRHKDMATRDENRGLFLQN